MLKVHTETQEVGGQNLGYQLPLFGPRGQIMPAILLPCPPIILDDAAFLTMHLLLDVNHHKTSVLNLMLSSEIFIRQHLNSLHT